MTKLEPTQPSQDVSVPIHGKCYFVHPGRRGRNFPCWQAPRVLPGTLSPALLTLLLFCNERKKDTRPDCPASRRRLHKVGFFKPVLRCGVFPSPRNTAGVPLFPAAVLYSLIQLKLKVYCPSLSAAASCQCVVSMALFACVWFRL